MFRISHTFGFSFQAIKSRTFGLLILALLLHSFSGAHAELTEKEAKQVIKRTLKMLKNDHYNPQQFTPEVSEEAFIGFLDHLDPSKVYFYQTEVNDWSERYKRTLETVFSEGDLTLIKEVRAVYTQRVQEVAEAGIALSEEEVDFTLDEVVEEYSQYPADKAEWLERWRKNVKSKMLTQLLVDENKPKEDIQKSLKTYFHLIQRELTNLSLDFYLETFVNAYAKTFDPHTSYLSPSTLEEFQIQMSLKLSGIGATLNGTEGGAEIVDVIKNGPAGKDGRLKAGDIILGVSSDGREENLEDVSLHSLKQIVERIRGRAGTSVLIKVRTKAGEIKIYDITRGNVDLSNSGSGISGAYGEIIALGKKDAGDAYQIGVIVVPSFYMDTDAKEQGKRDFRSTTLDVKKIIEQFKASPQGVDAIVIDVRNNGGGFLTEAIGLSGLFIDKAYVVQQKGPREITAVSDIGVEEDFYADYNEDTGYVAWKGPLVVITNRRSASASEIFAGFIQDHHRGLVIGSESTHGKGTVQNVIPIQSGGINLGFTQVGSKLLGALKLTIQGFYRVSGTPTQKIGVYSDVSVPSVLEEIYEGEASLKHSLEGDVIEPVAHESQYLVDHELVRYLQHQSDERVSNSAAFRGLIDKIEETKKKMASAEASSKGVSLNLKTRLAQKKEEERIAQESEDGNISAHATSFFMVNEQSDERALPKPVFDSTLSDYRNRELMSIVVDYLNFLPKN